MSQILTPSRQFWSDKLQEAEQSGNSLAEFARQQNIPVKKLYQWRSTLRSKVSVGLTTGRAPTAFPKA